MNTLAPLSERLRAAIAARGCTLATAAREMGPPGYPMVYQSVWRWAHGKTTPVGVHARLANAWIERNTP